MHQSETDPTGTAKLTFLRRIKKVLKLSWREIRARIAHRLRRRHQRRAYKKGTARAMDQPQLARLAVLLPRRLGDLLPGSKPAEIDKLRTENARMYEEISRRAGRNAQRLLDEPWSLLSRKINLTGAIDWHRDPLSDYRFDRVFYADVQVYELDGVDVKYVWELNRHQFLVELARGWRFTGEDRFAARARELIIDWIEENPLYEGVNWTSALEVAVRAVSWLWTLALTADYDGWQNRDWRRIVGSLADHAEYIRGHLSLFSSPYNHLIGEATALYLLSGVLDGLPRADLWGVESRRILAKHGPKQFYSDGFCVEQAVGYHFFTLGFLIQAVVASRAAGEPMEKLEMALPGAFTAGAAFRQPDDRWPAIGDVDSARSIPIHHDDFWDFRSLLSLGAVLFQLPELKTTAGAAGEEIFWLLGCGGLKAWDELDSRAAASTTVFPQAGYAIARSEEQQRADWLLFDAGPLADGIHHDSTNSVAHGHNDLLGLLLFQEGTPILVDCGIPDYNGPRQWVDHFRGPAAHNTLEVEGAPAARTAGRLAWSNACRRPRLDANLSAQAWLLRGRVELPAGASIQRAILGLPGVGVWIADMVKCGKPRKVRWCWHLPASAAPHVVADANCYWKLACQHGIVAMWTRNKKVSARLETASAESPIAWISEHYGARESGYRATWESQIEHNNLFVTFIGPKITPAAVKIGGLEVSCMAGLEPHATLSLDELGPDAVWLIETGQNLLVVAAGLHALPTKPTWTILKGTGAWPAACCVVPACTVI